ncbi:MAG: sorbosone dehydrogenase family protein [Novosphingobium sp.]|nr:sorbosone dehydrogenase family protein [Novosphingobium sp.]
MTLRRKLLIGFAAFIVILSALAWWATRGDTANVPFEKVTGTDPVLEEDYSAEKIPTVVIAEPVGWAQDESPKAAEGLAVTRFAEGLDHPRTMLALPNGDIVVAETGAPAGALPDGLVGKVMAHFMDKAGAGGPSPDKLILLRDSNNDGKADQRFTLREDDLASPSGLAYRDGKLLVANHNGVLAFPFEIGQTAITAKPEKLLDLPVAGMHWMRNLTISPDGNDLYVAIGSASNIGENGMEVEKGRASIMEYDFATKAKRPYAEGLRNPNGMAWNPATGELWTVVNERDMLGSDLVPDYLTNVPVGVQYGWPWVYWRNKVDRRVEAPMPQFLTEYTRRPEYALGPHVAALGLVFTGEGHLMGEKFGNGAFIAQHGSWNRKPLSGYDVVFVPFDKRGNPLEKPVPVLTGFLAGDGKTHGRPTWLAWDKAGALLVSDDTAGIIWRVTAPGAKPAPKPEALKSTPLPPQRNLRPPRPEEVLGQDYIRYD